MPSISPEGFEPSPTERNRGLEPPALPLGYGEVYTSLVMFHTKFNHGGMCGLPHELAL